ncbi:MAG: tryptophan--tRNA ligase [Candidatus Aenigmarchaeota archaeon ex4484_224]|nr:MAG: tryptophan--tRNA ligase [Candidatus Aenigmarchaeota archaeon ex4484_224]
MEKFKVTPWEVEGKVDYDKLVKEFGLKLINEGLKKRIVKHTKDLHFMLRRNIFFAHRDLDKVLNDYEKGKGFFLYTGRGPSGKMHLGHIIPFYFTKWLQQKFKVNVYIEITDDEKFLVKNQTWEEIKTYTMENILEIAAVGFDIKRTFIFRDSEYIANIYPLVLKVARKINFSLVKAVFGFKNSTNIGLIFYPAIQIIPTFFEKKRCLIPAAIDQDPYWRIQRDLAESFGYYKTAAIHSKFLMPLKGPTGKMSSSDPTSAIFLDDSEKDVERKIMKYAYSGGQPTIELHRKLGGNPEVDVSFQWLKYFFEPSDKKLKEIEEDYRSGKLLTGELKQILIEKIVKFLKEHSKRKEKAKDRIIEYMYEGKLARKMWEKQYE